MFGLVDVVLLPPTHPPNLIYKVKICVSLACISIPRIGSLIWFCVIMYLQYKSHWHWSSPTAFFQLQCVDVACLKKTLKIVKRNLVDVLNLVLNIKQIIVFYFNGKRFAAAVRGQCVTVILAHLEMILFITRSKMKKEQKQDKMTFFELMILFSESKLSNTTNEVQPQRMALTI